MLKAPILTGWRQSATRFIDPPTPELAAVWDSLPVGELPSAKLFKAPDFDGREEPDLDWAAAARKNLDFLLSMPMDASRGYPWYLTHSWQDTDPQGRALAYPCLHFPSFAFLFLEALKHEIDPRIEAALDVLIKATLECRVEEGMAKGMPLSVLVRLEHTDWTEEQRTRLTVFRMARMGEALLALYGYRKSKELLDYAEEIAAFIAKVQREDGSLPFRISPGTGKAVDSYTSAAISTVAFFEKLMSVTGDQAYRGYVDRVVQWTLEGPCKDMRWEGMYEDVHEAAPYANLENWDTLDCILYLLGPGKGRPGALELAKKLNRWVEDQFVVFGPVPGPVWGPVEGPLVKEQYCCYYPMEVHTAHWIQALEALYGATGDPVYRHKARRAANAIVKAQYSDGRFSTWGRNRSTGEPLSPEGDWYGCNAYASWILYQMPSF